MAHVQMSAEVTLSIRIVGPLSISVGPLVFDQGAAVSHQLTASGGNPPYAWESVSGAPPGLSLTAGGLISGTATAAGDFGWVVRVTDAAAG
jgi:hypothetical protein